MGTKYVIVSPWEYIWQQTLLTHPLAAPIWVAGLYFLLRDPLGKKYAVLAWAYFTVLAEMLILHGKIYYLAPAYILTSAEKRVDLAVVHAIQNLQHGQFAAGSNVFNDITNGGIGYGKIGPAGTQFAAQVQKVYTEMKAGKIANIPDTVP